MSVSNTIFNSNFSKQTIPQIERLDNGQMSGTEEVYFNTYRHWKPFDVPMQKVITGRKDSEGKAETAQVTAKGTKSLFNNYNAVYTDENFRIDANMPLLDTPDNRQSQREKTACTIQDLVKASASGLMGRQIYTKLAIQTNIRHEKNQF